VVEDGEAAHGVRAVEVGGAQVGEQLRWIAADVQDVLVQGDQTQRRRVQPV